MREREGEEKGEGGVGSEKQELPCYPRPPMVYIGKINYPEYPASGPENPDRPETPGIRPETPAPPQSEQTKAQKNLI